jgi:hypothetical protein
MSEQQARRWLEGNWAFMDGMAIPEWDQRIHVVELSPTAIARIVEGGAPVVIGIDHGANNPEAALWAVYYEGCLIFYREYYQAGNTIEHNCAAIGKLSTEPSCFAVIVDGTTRNFQAELKGRLVSKYRLYQAHLPPRLSRVLRPANNGEAGSREANRETFRTWLKVDPERIHPFTGQRGSPRLFVTADCTNLIRQVPNLRYRHGREGQNPSEDTVKVDDHAYDAASYALAFVARAAATPHHVRRLEMAVA